MSKTLVAGVSALALMFVWSGAASAQQAKCLAGKTKCMSKKAGGLLKCHQKAETPGKPLDPNAGDCVTKVVAKFDGGPTAPEKGCFEKLENKSPNDCITLDDTVPAEAAVDSCVGAFVAAIDPAPINQTKCGVGKKKCVAKLLSGLLKCQQKAQTPGKPTDPNADGCVDKATAKYTGGPEPAKGCFAKLEAKVPNDCQFTNDSGALQALVQDCVADLVAVVTNTTTTTTTSTTTTSTLPGLQGALTPTVGRFNYNLMIGLPAANAACNTNFPGTHACTYQELQAAQTAGQLAGLTDTAAATVTSFWAIDSTMDPLDQCQDDVGSLLNWEYATAHTPSRGTKVPLNNAAGTLGALQTDLQCNFSGASWVGCCS